MVTMSVQDALKAVMLDIEQMSAEELRRELDANRQGDIATTLREVRSYLLADAAVFHYPLAHLESILSNVADLVMTEHSVSKLNEWVAANSDFYAMAA